ncbi:MAG: poly-gamma-glutamate synthase PgsB [Bacteroidales bacterium]|nr:poly-gamma-glutamate synthase PgsB [Bacteroidales bacterium]
MLTVSVVLFVILALLIMEERLFASSIAKIRNRIHVNGTRGKSTVTEYIAAAIHENGVSTFAKITGVRPTLIHNGSRKSIKRAGGARIQEQFRIIRTATKRDCENFVLECMSINPGLQKIESKFFRPHIYVITNIRDDHREVMGSTEELQVRAICEAIPPNCTVLTGQGKHLREIGAVASEKNSHLVVADFTLLEGIEKRLPVGVFRENIAIALTVSRLLGTDRDVAFDRILKIIERQDPRLTILDKERDVLVLNGFDVNDTDSAEIFLNHWLSEIGEPRKILTLFNTRADRPHRTDLFAKWIVNIPDLAYIFITGNHHRRATRAIQSAGIELDRIHMIKPKEIKQIRKRILDLAGDKTLILTIGNIGGDGFNILNAIT